jgi:hypothetical protein
MNEPNDTSGIVPIKSEEEFDAEIEEIIKEMEKLFDEIDWEALAKEEENTKDE